MKTKNIHLSPFNQKKWARRSSSAVRLKSTTLDSIGGCLSTVERLNAQIYEQLMRVYVCVGTCWPLCIWGGTEAQAVSNNKRVHIIILWQVIISVMKFLDLLGTEDMNLSIERCQSSIFQQEVHEIVSINKGRFKNNQNRIKGMWI